MGSLVTIHYESAENEIFENIAHQLALHVVASGPIYLDPKDITKEDYEKIVNVF